MAVSAKSWAGEGRVLPPFPAEVLVKSRGARQKGRKGLERSKGLAASFEKGIQVKAGTWS